MQYPYEKYNLDTEDKIKKYIDKLITLIKSTKKCYIYIDNNNTNYNTNIITQYIEIPSILKQQEVTLKVFQIKYDNPCITQIKDINIIMIPSYVLDSMYYMYQDNKLKKNQRNELYHKLYKIYQKENEQYLEYIKQIEL